MRFPRIRALLVAPALIVSRTASHVTAALAENA
jgi:hypothetical protein